MMVVKVIVSPMTGVCGDRVIDAIMRSGPVLASALPSIAGIRAEAKKPAKRDNITIIPEQARHLS
jgi:hypothetical protein